MKARTFILTILALTALLAVDSPKPESPSQYGAVTLESLDAVGLLRLNGTTVSDTLHITGSLIAQNATLNLLDITGQANLTSTTVKNPSYIMGSLQATRSTFEKQLTLLSAKALFTSCRLDAITVRQDSSYKGKQVLELRQSTLISGPVHFESGKGEIHVYPGSQVIGPVTGGKVVKKT